MKTIKKEVKKNNLTFNQILSKLGGKTELNKVIKSIRTEQNQKLNTIKLVGGYGYNLVKYHQSNLKGTISLKKWYLENFQALLNFDYTQLTTYIKVYKYEDRIDEYNKRKGKDLAEGNFSSKNQMLTYIRSLQPKTKKPTKVKEGEKVLSWYVGDSNIMRNILISNNQYKFKFGKDTKTNPIEDILPHIKEIQQTLKKVEMFYNVQVNNVTNDKKTVRV